MRKVLVSALALVAALSSCAPAGPPTDVVWDPPDRYEFTLESYCGEHALGGVFHVVVRDGEVAEVEPLDHAARRSLQAPQARDGVPTLSDLLDEAARARDVGADVVDLVTTEEGRPEEIRIDGNLDAYDDEACYRIVNYSDGS